MVEVSYYDTCSIFDYIGGITAQWSGPEIQANLCKT